MKRSIYFRSLVSFFLIFAMLSPAAALAAGDGKKHFKAGMKHEVAEEWDKAAEEFALAVADNPKNPEYRLHLRRALFNASQMFMAKGRMLAGEKDFEGAYVAFRRAYAYDPVNELAKSEMARMVRLQKEVLDGGDPDPQSNGDVKLVPTSANGADPTGFQIPQKLEKLRDVPFPSGVNLQFIVKELAKDLDLNVLFEAESRLDNRQVKIELRNVTAAKALDYIFLQENLFFQRVGPRTILVASNQRRTLFQQLVLRTFYLANASPKDVKTIIQTAIPAQPGRSQTIVLEDESTNSVTVRDTAENIALIGSLIESLDKDRAEVVMDVAIYEVNKNDLLQFGNQIGSGGPDGTLLNLGGIGLPYARRGSTGPITDNIPFPNLDIASIAIGLPISTLQALQSKNDTKLIASTQIHAFNNEDSSARIGQRVPVRTATFQTANNSSGGVVSDVINYEQVGLTLKFKPIVFPNQDVQVAMEIESKDVSGAATLTPIFTERTIKGTARVQNNKTLLLASVAQGIESRGRTGLPLLGLIPIIGRFFTAPTRDNRQVDIVIAITPRVIRAPAILPEDEVERPTGSIAVPTSGSLEAMIIQEEREEYLASIRRIPNTAQIQLPDRPAEAELPSYVRTGDSQSKTTPAPAQQPAVETPTPKVDAAAALKLRPIDSSVRSLKITETSDTSNAATPETPDSSPAADQGSSVPTGPSARLYFDGAFPAMKAGDRMTVPVLVDGTTPFRSTVLGLRFDEKLVAVRSVKFGDVFGSALSGTDVAPFLNQNGRMFVTLSHPDGAVEHIAGSLAFIEIEALADTVPELYFEKEVLNFTTKDGETFRVSL